MNNHDKTGILTRIQQIKAEFYETNRKNVFFKKTQKQELSNRIIQELSIQDLVDVSIYPLSGNHIYVDYSIIKIYLDSSVYDKILEKMITLLAKCCTSDKKYNIHINLEGFTITSAERHKGIIEAVCQKINNTHFFDNMEVMYIYNTPAMIDTISSMFSYLIHPNMKHKMVKYGKSESPEKLCNLLGVELVCEPI